MDTLLAHIVPGNWLRVFISTRGTGEPDLIYNIHEGQVDVETSEEFLYQEESVGGLVPFNFPGEGDYSDCFELGDLEIPGKILRIELFRDRPSANVRVLFG